MILKVQMFPIAKCVQCCWKIKFYKNIIIWDTLNTYAVHILQEFGKTANSFTLDYEHIILR